MKFFFASLPLLLTVRLGFLQLNAPVYGKTQNPAECNSDGGRGDLKESVKKNKESQIARRLPQPSTLTE